MKAKNRTVVIEADWLSFMENGKEISSFGFVPELEIYQPQIAAWVNGKLGIRELKAFVKKVIS